MPKVGIAGDWHGNDRWAVSALEYFYAKGVTEVYHVGDFGIWPGADGELFLQRIITTCEALGISLLITPGNHEDYSQIEDPETTDGVVPAKQVLANGKGWEVSILPRGYIWEYEGKRFLSLGGAPSVDFDRRKKDVDWWEQEMIRESDLLRLSGEDMIDVMLCHDSPEGGTGKVQTIIEIPPEKSFFSERGLNYAAEGRILMDKAVSEVNPRWFFHGHYHVADYRYDSIADRHYVSMDLDGSENNVGILSWYINEDMNFEFYGGDTWMH